VRLRLGIGGRAFGVRGGISNRGFGVGVGPLSVGSSWRRRRRRSGGGWGLILILAAIGWLISLCDPTPTTTPTITTTPTTAPFYVPPTTTRTSSPPPPGCPAKHWDGYECSDPCAEGGTWDGSHCVSKPGDLPWCIDGKCAPQYMDPCPIPGAVPHGGPCWVTSTPTPTPTPTRWGLPPAEWQCLPTDPNPEQASPDPRCENW
jgi:hypothetical protein